MTNRNLWWGAMLVGSLGFGAADAAHGQAPGQPVVRNIEEMKFTAVPGLPSCAPGAVQSGDPAKGASIILGKLAAGCAIPWHWHTSNEHLMLVSGAARVEAKGAQPVALRPGGFAIMPSRHVHQFRCTAECLLYVYSDAAFDILYVNAKGTEIPSVEALKGGTKPN